MKRILVKRFAEPPGGVSVLVVGLPGLGLVGATAARILLSVEDGQRPKLVARFHPYVFLMGTYANRSGTVSVQGASMRYRSLAKFPEGLLVLTADSQPSPDFQHEFAWSVLSEAKRFGCRTVITLGAFQTLPAVQRRVYFCANDLDSYKVASKLGLDSFDGRVTGAAGVFAGIGKLLGFSGGCMLGEISGEAFPDVTAASAVVSELLAFLTHDSKNVFQPRIQDERKNFMDSLS
ncbi:MAG: PAC2 family protein [Candidatus Brockarchaeota archaeon]|nr:PAC2 family protein [Candidatus Brockarchaeota archaeon]